MTKPVTIPNTFATATTAIPLSNLDADFSTVATAMNDANTYSNYAPDTGSANAYVVTLTGVSTTYSAGLRIQFKAGNANTTASTLNVNAQGAKNITYQDASAIASGTIAANSIVDVMYDGTQFLLMNDPAGGTGGDVVGPASATDNAIVRFDGTTGKLVQNSVVTIADSTGDISGVGQLNATTVDTTNLEVTNIKAKDGTAAATIADSTGVVTVTAAPVMTALTASQAVFTTAGKALTSNAITGTGNVVMSASPTLTGTISAAAATLSGNLTLSGGTANGVLYLDGSKVATSGSALTFDGTNLGVGVTPSYKLDVAWNSGATERARLRNSSSSTAAITLLEIGNDANNSLQIFQRSSTASAANESVLQNNSGGMLTFATISDTPIRFLQNNIEQMRLTSTGLGIGTSSPGYKLEVVSPSGDNITSLFRSGDATAANNAGGGFRNISSSTASSRLAQIWLDADGANLSGGDYFIINKYGNSGNVELNQFSNAAMLFLTNNTERARIDSSGNLLVGTTSSYSSKVSILWDSSGQSGIVIRTSSTTLSGNPVIFQDSSGVAQGSISQTASSVSYNTSSDYRLKDNPQPLTGSGAFIDALQPKTWNWKADGSRGVGFIAHEVQEVSPGSVVGEKDGEQMQAMEYGSAEFIANIIAELQSLRTRVAALESN